MRATIRPPVRLLAPVFVALLTGALSVCLSPSDASAKPRPAASKDQKRARALGKEAHKAYQGGDFVRAEALVRGAYALDPAPVLVYNLAEILDAKGDVEGARDAYKRYLTLVPQAKARLRILKRIEVLEEDLRRRASLEAQIPPLPAPPPTSVPDLAKRAPAPGRTRIWPWVTLSTGAVAVGTGAVFGVFAQSQQNEARDAREQLDAARSLDRAETFATTANVLYIVGGVVMAAGLSGFLFGGDDEPPIVGAVVAPDLIGAVGRF